MFGRAGAFQLTAARRRLPSCSFSMARNWTVSTHSRSKAAAHRHRRRHRRHAVSTHSRSKAAAVYRARGAHVDVVSTHSRTKAAALRCAAGWYRGCRFNSQPLEGGCRQPCCAVRSVRGFNSQPLEGGCSCRSSLVPVWAWFQLTAARRRLPTSLFSFGVFHIVSTHSRSKAAA